VAAVSDFALIVPVAMEESFDQCGMRPPLHQCYFTDRLLRILANDWDRLGGGNVVARNPVFVPRGAVEIFLDKLLPSRQSVASAHGGIMADSEGSNPQSVYSHVAMP